MKSAAPPKNDVKPVRLYGSGPLHGIYIILLLIILGGCASKGTQNFQTPVGNLFQQSGYEKMLKRQMASIPPEPEGVNRLPEMTLDDYERLGDNYFRQGNLELAFLQYTKVMGENPDNVNVVSKRGFIYLQRGMSDLAMNEFAFVLEREPSHALAHQGMGMAHLRMRNYRPAKDHLQQSVQANPDLWLAHNFLGIVHDHLGEHEKAVKSYQAAITIKPDQSALYNNLGVSFAFMGRHEEAAGALRRGLQLRPVDPRLGNNLGMVLCKLGRYHEAIEAFRSSGDEAQAYNNLGAFLLEEREYAKASRAFQRALELRGSHYAKAHDNLRRAEIAIKNNVAKPGPAAHHRSARSSPLPVMEMPAPAPDYMIRSHLNP